MTRPLLRRATAEDAEAIADCMQAAYAPFAAQIADLPDVTGGWPEEIREFEVWVAVETGSVLGAIVLKLGQMAKLANVAVHPEMGGKGVGRALIDKVEGRAREEGYDALHLATHAAMPGNVKLYQRLGWNEAGRSGNTILMVKPL